VRQGKHVVMSDGAHFITIPRHNPVNAITLGGIVKDAGAYNRSVQRSPLSDENPAISLPALNSYNAPWRTFSSIAR